MATGNTFSNMTGILIPPLGVLCRRIFAGGNPWLPFFGVVSVIQMVCATLFCKLAVVESAASLLAKKKKPD